MMIIVTQSDGRKAAINTEKIIWVEGIYHTSHSIIYCTGCEPLYVVETPEEIAEMFNNKY